MGLRKAAILAIVLVLLPTAALLAYKHWLDTRIPVPLEIPVSLARGHITTRDFYINLRGEYGVLLTVDSPFGYYSDCPAYGENSVINTHLVLWQNSEKLAERKDDGYLGLATLSAYKEANYHLDIDILSDASCLNAGHPQLKVVSYDLPGYFDLYQTALWYSLIPILTGLGLFAYTMFAAFATKQTIDQSPIAESAFGTPTRALPISEPVSALPQFGLYCGTVLGCLVFVVMVLTAPMTSKGIDVSVIRPTVTLPSTGLTAVVVHVEDSGPKVPPRVFVNGNEVGWNELSRTLRDRLKIQPNWAVYVEADPNVAWQSAVDAMDIARSLHARVILLTPETRKQLGTN